MFILNKDEGFFYRPTDQYYKPFRRSVMKRRNRLIATKNRKYMVREKGDVLHAIFSEYSTVTKSFGIYGQRLLYLWKQDFIWR